MKTLTYLNKGFLVLTLSLFSITTAYAGPIVSTLPATSSNTVGVGGTNDYAAGFVWDSALDFSYAELYLGVEGNPADTFGVSIYNSVGGSPGTLVNTLSGSVAPSTTGIYTYSGVTALTQGAIYWLVASTGNYADTANEYIWYDGTLGDTNYVDTKWIRPSSSGWNSSGAVSPAAFAVYAQVPEPSMLILLALGLLGMTARRRKALI